MSTTPPRVSVIMSVYNRQQYLDESVRSVLEQTFAGFEFIVIDDGSTDGSKAIIEQHAGRDDRIRLVSRPNAGLIVSLNEAVSLARGPYLARMDDDDVCLPQRFEKQVKYLEAHADCVAVGSRVVLIDPDGDELGPFRFVQTHDEIEQSHLQGVTGAIVHPSTMIRRDAMDRIGGYRREWPHIEDYDLFLRLGEIGRLANLPEVLLKYRRHPDTICREHSDVQIQLRAHLLADAYARRGLTDPLPDPPPRMDHEHPADLFRGWGRMAWRAGHRRTARKHLRRSLMKNPFSMDSWRMAVRMLVGPPRDRVGMP